MHDLRRTAASGMLRIGIAPHVVDKILNHKIKGIARVYLRYEYAAERRAALEAWAAHVESVVSGESADVVSLAERRRKPKE